MSGILHSDFIVTRRSTKGFRLVALVAAAVFIEVFSAGANVFEVAQAANFSADQFFGLAQLACGICFIHQLR